jgi:hypothetical protein
MKQDKRSIRVSGSSSWLQVKHVRGICIMMVASLATAKGANGDDAALPRKIDRTEFQRQSAPNESRGGAGALESRSGSYVQDTRVVRESFALADGSKGGVSVEIIAFPKGYRFPEHDLFGSLLRTAAQDDKRGGSAELSAAADKVRCAEWEFADGSKGGTVCDAWIRAEQKQNGTVGWFNRSAGEGVVTLSIGYGPFDGLPGQVIDEYLRKYPSDVPAQPTWHLDWETKDIEKWVEILRANKDDVPMLQAGAAYLTRYEKRSFGLLDALRKRDDAAAFSQALDGVNERMSRWVEERKKASEARQKGE